MSVRLSRNSFLRNLQTKELLLEYDTATYTFMNVCLYLRIYVETYFMSIPKTYIFTRIQITTKKNPSRKSKFRVGTKSQML